MRHLSLTLILSSSVLTFAGDPPPPNLEQPVDYVAWINKEFGAGIKENAADRYAKASRALVDDEAASKLARESPRSWTPAQRRTVAEWVQRNEAALAEFHAAARIRRCYFEGTSELGTVIETHYPQLHPLRELTHAAAARAKLRLMEGDVGGALEDLGTILRSSRHDQEQPVVMSYLLGLAVGMEAYDLLAELPVIVTGDVDYAMLLKQLRKLDHRPPSMRAALQGERAAQYDIVQRCAVDEDGDGRIEAMKIPHADDGVTEVQVSHIPFTRALEITELVGYFDDYLNSIRDAEELRYPDALSLERKSEATTTRMGIAAWSLESLWRIDKFRRARDAQRHATRIILRMHAWRASNGTWPNTLKEAMSEELPTLRWDPFSDGELIYRIEEGQPLLYSVGANGRDDQGRRQEGDRLGEKGDIVFWPLSKD
jgi:hypothetical protein